MSGIPTQPSRFAESAVVVRGNVHHMNIGRSASSSQAVRVLIFFFFLFLFNTSYAAYNRFSGLRNDQDIYQTFEGGTIIYGIVSVHRIDSTDEASALIVFVFFFLSTTDNTVLMQQVAKDLLNQYQKQFKGKQFSGMCALK